MKSFPVFMEEFANYKRQRKKIEKCSQSSVKVRDVCYEGEGSEEIFVIRLFKDMRRRRPFLLITILHVE